MRKYTRKKKVKRGGGSLQLSNLLRDKDLYKLLEIDEGASTDDVQREAEPLSLSILVYIARESEELEDLYSLSPSRKPRNTDVSKSFMSVVRRLSQVHEQSLLVCVPRQ